MLTPRKLQSRPMRRKHEPSVPRSERPSAEARKAANMAALMVPSRALSRATYAGGVSGVAIEKTKPQRNRRLLDLAEGMPCLLLVPGCCNHRTDTTCACHSNISIHGKAGRRKADDHWSCFGCSACHWWLDFGPAPADLKRDVFMAGMERQILTWKVIAADPARVAADHRAARWALERHGV